MGNLPQFPPRGFHISPEMFVNFAVDGTEKNRYDNSIKLVEQTSLD